ncbi:MAG: BT0820 family HAD-type phosphatase [Prevotella sp.]
MIIAVDFDGTIVEHAYPKIGKEKIFATDTLRQLINDGHQLILWTVREGDLLDEAVEWCRKRGVEFYAINKDFPEENTSKNQHYSRKIKADVWIDDLNVGGLPDWGTIYRIITEKKTLQQIMEEKLVNSLPQPPKKKWWQI